MRRILVSGCLVFSACESATADTVEIVGTWNCHILAKTDSGSADNQWTVSYTPDGRFTYEGTTHVTLFETSNEHVISVQDEGTYSISSGVLSAQSQKRSSELTPIKGPIVTDKTLRERIENYLASRDEERLTTPFRHKIFDLNENRMNLIPLTETTEDMISCNRIGGA